MVEGSKNSEASLLAEAAQCHDLGKGLSKGPDRPMTHDEAMAAVAQIPGAAEIAARLRAQDAIDGALLTPRQIQGLREMESGA